MSLGLAWVVALYLAQVPGPTAQTGSAMIAGRVTMDDRSPLRGALVTITGSEIRHPQVTATDGDGRFEFRSLPAGRFVLSATKSGFVRQYYGAKRPAVAAGIPIVVTAGQRFDAPLTMTQAGSIKGTLLLPPGVPAASLRVVALQPVSGGGERRWMAVGGAYGVGDDGAFRIPGLAPNEYQIFVTAAGATTEFEVTTPETLQWANRVLDPTQTSTPAAPRSQRRTFAPVFYPGVTRAADAVAIKVGAGEDRVITLPVPLVPSARVTGQVLDPDGQPPDAFQVWLIDESAPVPRLALQMRSERAGRFSVGSVTPGSYLVAARAAARGSGVVQPQATGDGHPAGAPPGAQLWAMDVLTIDGTDLDVTLRLRPGRTVAGRLALDSRGPARDRPRVRVNLVPVTANLFALSTSAVEAGPEGQFEISHVIPGTYRLEVTVLPAEGSTVRWAVKSAMTASGIDVLDDALVVMPDADERSLVVTLTDQPTEFSGRVLDSSARPISEFTIMVFPAESRLWKPQSRRIALARPGSDGSFSFVNLPPGDYYVCALSDVDTAQSTDPTFLEQLVPAAFRVTLQPGEMKKQDLRIGSGGR